MIWDEKLKRQRNRLFGRVTDEVTYHLTWVFLELHIFPKEFAQNTRGTETSAVFAAGANAMT